MTNVASWVFVVHDADYIALGSPKRFGYESIYPIRSAKQGASAGE